MFECNVRNLRGVYLGETEMLNFFLNGGTIDDLKKVEAKRAEEANRCLEYANEKGLTKMEFIEIFESCRNCKKTKYKKFTKKVDEFIIKKESA